VGRQRQTDDEKSGATQMLHTKCLLEIQSWDNCRSISNCSYQLSAISYQLSAFGCQHAGNGGLRLEARSNKMKFCAT
jgi:hypothetical protein